MYRYSQYSSYKGKTRRLETRRFALSLFIASFIHSFLSHPAARLIAGEVQDILIAHILRDTRHATSTTEVRVTRHTSAPTSTLVSTSTHYVHSCCPPAVGMLYGAETCVLSDVGQHKALALHARSFYLHPAALDFPLDPYYLSAAEYLVDMRAFPPAHHAHSWISAGGFHSMPICTGFLRFLLSWMGLGVPLRWRRPSME